MAGEVEYSWQIPPAANQSSSFWCQYTIKHERVYCAWSDTTGHLEPVSEPVFGQAKHAGARMIRPLCQRKSGSETGSRNVGR